jgi:hypothetical protein
MVARLRVALDHGLGLRTTGIVVAEAWRDPAGRQANLARLLKSTDVRAVDIDIGREAGLLLGKSGSGDAPDATVVVVAETGDRVLTSDPSDIERLVQASGRSILVVAC